MKRVMMLVAIMIVMTVGRKTAGAHLCRWSRRAGGRMGRTLADQGITRFGQVVDIRRRRCRRRM